MPGKKRLISIVSILLIWSLTPAATDTPADPPGAQENPGQEAPAPSDVPVRPDTGAPAPLFPVPDLDGRSVDVAGLVEGKPALLTFWATWCRPCIDEIPELRTLARTYRRRGFVILGIGLQEGGETPDKQRRMAARQLVNYQLVYDDEGSYQKAWSLQSLPYNVLLDADGHIAWQGELLPGDLDERVRNLIVKARRREGSPQG